MKRYTKSAVIEVIDTLPNGDKLVQNKGNDSDTWVIPKDVFESTYVEYIPIVDEFENRSQNFGWAVKAIKAGKKVARKGWNDKDMFIYYVASNKYPMSNNLMETMADRYEDDLVPYQAYVALKTADDTVVPWLASQSDMLAEDWESVD